MRGGRTSGVGGTFRFGVLDLPAELLRAQQEGSLVVFAGAGVSKPAPSGLPDFGGLVAHLAGRELTDEESQRLDWALGQFQDGGIDVHRRAAEKLRDPSSRPNDLHRDLLGLFKRPEAVRLVTTNFDLHFEAAARELWPDKNPDQCPEVWRAPALPLGDAFQGIVHLHGALDRPAERLVLTDRDFSRAYLTEGWARRFLLRLFPKFTVLFVGYSHNDPLVDYLARGLPPDAPGSRFALSENGTTDWQYLGIQPILYGNADGIHQEAAQTISDWSSHTQRGALENQVRAREILTRPPDRAEPGELDFLRWCLDHETHWRFFTDNAGRDGWLAWLDECGLLRRMLDGSLIGEQTNHLGDWIGRNVVEDADFASRANRRIASYRTVLSAHTWRCLVDPVVRRWRSTEGSKEHLAAWVATLIDCCPEGADLRWLSWLLVDLDAQVDRDLFLLLFDFLTEPRLTSRRFAALSPGGSSIAVTVRGHAIDLQRGVRAKLAPSPAAFAEAVLAIGERHLRRAEAFERVSGITWKAVSGHRKSIRPSPQDDAGRNFSGIHALIDITHLALHWRLQEKPSVAVPHVLAWCRGDNTLLRRLGIDALSEAKTLTADQKLGEGLTAGWLRSSFFREEVRHLLEGSYPEAGRETRQQVVEVLKSIFCGKEDNDPEEARRQSRQLHHWLGTLLATTRGLGCDVLECEMADLERRFPGIAEKEPEPEPEPVPTVDEILSLEPDDLIELVQASRSKARLGDPESWDGWEAKDPLPDLLRQATAHDFEWSINVARFLGTSQREIGMVWRPLCDGWQSTALSGEQWATLMTTLVESPPTAGLHRRLAELLEERIESNQLEGVEVERYFGASLPLARYLLSESTDDRDRLDWDGVDWLRVAEDSTAGGLGLFLLASVSRLREAREDGSLRAAEDLLSFAADLLHPDAGRSRLGIPVLCAQLAYFDHYDPEWTREHLLPCFDWDEDRRTAAQAWQGFASWGRLSPSVWKELSPLLPTTLQHLDDLDGPQIRDPFVDKLAEAVFFLEEDQPPAWLRNFLVAANHEWKALWGYAVHERLLTLSPEATREAGEAWLARYFEWRIDLTPAPLAEKEWEAMHLWALFLPDHFHELVPILKRREVVVTNLDEFLAALLGTHPRMKIDREALLSQPNDVAIYLLHLLNGEVDPQPWALGDLSVLITDLETRGASRDLIAKLKDRYVEMGGRVDPNDLPKPD